jgi:hypothetical protein
MIRNRPGFAVRLEQRIRFVGAETAGPCRRDGPSNRHGIIHALTETGVEHWTDKAYRGAGGFVRVPFRGRRLKRWKRRHDTAHAEIHCVGEQPAPA